MNFDKMSTNSKIDLVLGFLNEQHYSLRDTDIRSLILSSKGIKIPEYELNSIIGKLQRDSYLNSELSQAGYIEHSINIGGSAFYFSGGYSKLVDLPLSTDLPRKKAGIPTNTQKVNAANIINRISFWFMSGKTNDKNINWISITIIVFLTD
jgi:hypothetical protein